MSYSQIKSLDEFWEKLWQRARELFPNIEPQFVSKFLACQQLGLPIDQCCKESIPLLSGKFETFIDLMESLHEVRYYWKRLSEAYRLFKISPLIKISPLSTEPLVSESEWFIYHLDFWWHALYGLFDRFNIFITRLDRRLNLPKDSEVREYIRNIRGNIEQTREPIAKIRDPVAHYRSQGLQGLRKDHIWEGDLVLNLLDDRVTLYDEAFMLHRDYYEEFVSNWTSLIKDVVLEGTFSILVQKVPFDKIG
jgi:hypothetical protein